MARAIMPKLNGLVRSLMRWDRTRAIPSRRNRVRGGGQAGLLTFLALILGIRSDPALRRCRYHDHLELGLHGKHHALLFTAYMIPAGFFDNVFRPVVMARSSLLPLHQKISDGPFLSGRSCSRACSKRSRTRAERKTGEIAAEYETSPGSVESLHRYPQGHESAEEAISELNTAHREDERSAMRAHRAVRPHRRSPALSRSIAGLIPTRVARDAVAAPESAMAPPKAAAIMRI